MTPIDYGIHGRATPPVPGKARGSGPFAALVSALSPNSTSHNCSNKSPADSRRHSSPASVRKDSRDQPQSKPEKRGGIFSGLGATLMTKSSPKPPRRPASLEVGMYETKYNRNTSNVSPVPSFPKTTSTSNDRSASDGIDDEGPSFAPPPPPPVAEAITAAAELLTPKPVRAANKVPPPRPPPPPANALKKIPGSIPQPSTEGGTATLHETPQFLEAAGIDPFASTSATSVGIVAEDDGDGYLTGSDDDWDSDNDGHDGILKDGDSGGQSSYSEPQTGGNLFKVIYPWEPQEAGQISIAVGDVVEVPGKRAHDGWWTGRVVWSAALKAYHTGPLGKLFCII